MHVLIAASSNARAEQRPSFAAKGHGHAVHPARPLRGNRQASGTVLGGDALLHRIQVEASLGTEHLLD